MPTNHGIASAGSFPHVDCDVVNLVFDDRNPILAEVMDELPEWRG